jgi:hypothetical protein
MVQKSLHVVTKVYYMSMSCFAIVPHKCPSCSAKDSRQRPLLHHVHKAFSQSISQSMIYHANPHSIEKDTLPIVFLISKQSSSSLLPYELVSWLLAICWVQKPSVLQFHSKTIEFATNIHTTSQTVLSLNSLGNYYHRKTWHTTDSYLNFIRTAEHKLLTYFQESDLIARSVYRFEGDE